MNFLGKDTPPHLAPKASGLPEGCEVRKAVVFCLSPRSWLSPVCRRGLWSWALTAQARRSPGEGGHPLGRQSPWGELSRLHSVLNVQPHLLPNGNLQGSWKTPTDSKTVKDCQQSFPVPGPHGQEGVRTLTQGIHKTLPGTSSRKKTEPPPPSGNASVSAEMTNTPPPGERTVASSPAPLLAVITSQEHASC